MAEHGITPRDILRQVAEALPEEVRGDVIIVGSLAAGYQLLRDQGQVVRTKDVDCMMAPHAKALISARKVTDRLLGAGWKPHAPRGYILPGTPETRDDELAMVRLHPPQTTEWFVELMGAPASVVPAQPDTARTTQRLETSGGHFALASFAYLGLVQYEPTESEFGVRVALPEMMALANLLHHPNIGSALMSQLFEDRQIKRANKDLGRVVALAHLAGLADEDAVERWPSRWRSALEKMAREHVEPLLTSAPAGLHALLGSSADSEQALHSLNYGLLSASPMTSEQFTIALQRTIQNIERV